MKASSAAAVAVGAISAIPGVPAVINTLESQAPADTGAADAAASDAMTAEGGAGQISESVVVHYDPATGQTALYAGTREVVVKDPRLAAQIAKALH
ncbi:MAG: hypothetical protein JO368_12815 [Acidimicrobiales bacterium]|nr:hypothetical protein [Acidimicrobiales bacterium]